MGAGNVKMAYAHWYGLPDLPFRVLTYMAVVSTDKDEEPAYWGGWEALALAAGRLVPDRNDTDPAVKKVRRAALKAVSTVIQTLIDRKAISVKVPAAPGRNATYALNLANRTVHAGRAPSADIDEPNGSRLPDTTVHGERAQRFTVTRPTVHGEREPEEYEEEGRTKPRNESADLDLTVTVSRAREADEDPEISPAEVQPDLQVIAGNPDAVPAGPEQGRLFPAPVRPARNPLRRTDRGQAAIAEASARRRASEAAYRAQSSAEEVSA